MFKFKALAVSGIAFAMAITAMVPKSSEAASWFDTAEQVSHKVSNQYRGVVQEVCNNIGCSGLISPDLVLSFISVESGIENGECAVSKDNAKGPMQVLPIVIKDLGLEPAYVDLCNTRHNIEAGVLYLNSLQHRYKMPDQNTLIAAYLMGPNGVKRIKDIDQFYYVQRVQTASVYINEVSPNVIQQH